MDGSVGDAVVAGGVAAISLLLKSTLILGVAWILAIAARRSSAAVRHGIWVAALLAAVTLPLTSLWLPPLEIELPLGLVTEGTRSDGPGAPAVAPPTPGADATPLGGGAAQVGGSGIGDRLATDPPNARGLDWLLTLLAVWLLGTLARASWLGAQLVRVRHLTRYEAAPVRDDRLGAVGDIKRLLRTSRPVVLLESARIATPLTYGLLRPIILLPKDSRGWPEDRLRVVLLHELAHIRRWDYVTCLIAEAACALYWPVPLVWVARRSVQAEQEQASDDLVLAAGTPAVDYADHLLSIARTLRAESRAPAATIGMAREIGLKRRIRTILDGHTRRSPLRSWHGALTLLALCGFSLPVAAIRAGTGMTKGAADLNASALAPALQLGAPAPAVTPPEADLYLWLEAEHGLMRGAMEPREDLDASDGHFVAAAGERDAGETILSLNVPRAGQYAVWARVAGGPTDGDGLTISLDDRELGLIAREAAGERSQGWRWIRLGDARSGFLTLDPGIHTLRLAYSSGDRRLDRVLVTSDGDYLPSGRGASPVGFLPQYSWIDVGAGAVTGATEYVFEAETSGSYVLWGRVMGRDSETNSFFFSVDDGPEMIWDAPRRDLGRERGRWTWDPASARDIGGRRADPLILDLTRGQHTVRLRARESGTGLSGLLVTNDLTYRPRGTPPGTPTVQVWLEPETAAPAGGLRVRQGTEAVGAGYLEATNRGRGVSDPGEDGSAALRFDLPHPGVYTVWARTVARSGGEDSFWIRVNDEPWVRWNGIPRSREWRWSAVHDADGAVEPVQFALPAGENRIEIARREGGTRLDRLLLTNQDRFEPAGTGAE